MTNANWELRHPSPGLVGRDLPRPLGALPHNNNRGALLVPSDFHMEER